MTNFLLCLSTAGCFHLCVGQRSSEQQQQQCSVFQTNNDRLYCWPWQCPLLPLWERRSRAGVLLLSDTNSLCLFNTMFCCSQTKMENVIVLSNVLHSPTPHTFLFFFSFVSPFMCSVTWTSPSSWISKASCAKQPYLTTTRCVKLDLGDLGAAASANTHDHERETETLPWPQGNYCVM